MECLTEFTCSVYVDGELPEPERRKVEEHLAVCNACRGLTAAFREESRLLVHYIQEIDLLAPHSAALPDQVAASTAASHSARPTDIVKFSGLLIGLTTLVRLAMTAPENFALPSIPVSLDWLNPSDLSGRLNWLLSSISYVSSEGVSRMASLVNSLSVVVLFVLILAGGVMFVRRSIGRGAMATLAGALGMILMVVAVSSSGYAMDFRNAGKDKVTVIPAGQVIDDSLVATGDTVIIDGTINGDLFAFARLVTVHGAVKGNIITGAQSIDLSGSVDGSILAGGQTIQINGHVAHNVAAFGQSITLGKDANIDGNAVTGGNEGHMNGNVGRDFFAFGFLDIAGSVGRNLLFRGAILSVLPTAHIGGDLTAHVQKPDTVRIDASATIGGKKTIDVQAPGPSKYTTFGFYFSELIRVAAAFVTGLIFLLLFPIFRRSNFSDFVAVLKSGGIGFIAAVAIPIAAFIVAITFVGLPVALVAFVVWLLGLYLAKIVVANFVGRTLLATQGDRVSSMALGLLVGLALIFVAINLPYIGGLLHFLLVLIGFGALLMDGYGLFQASHDSGK